MIVWKYLFIAVAAYLMGCVSTGLLVARNSGHDLRTEGSQNTGATNVLRVLGAKKGALTFAGDFAKAMLAMLLGKWIGGQSGALIASLMVVIGHNWPVFHEFKGGKGVACSIAVMFLFFWQGIIAGAVAILVIWKTKYISAGSLTLLALFAILLIITEPFWPVGVWALALAALSFYRHRANIQRLMNGTENKLNLKKKA